MLAENTERGLGLIRLTNGEERVGKIGLNFKAFLSWLSCAFVFNKSIPNSHWCEIESLWKLHVDETKFAREISEIAIFTLPALRLLACDRTPNVMRYACAINYVIMVSADGIEFGNTQRGGKMFVWVRSVTHFSSFNFEIGWTKSCLDSLPSGDSKVAIGRIASKHLKVVATAGKHCRSASTADKEVKLSSDNEDMNTTDTGSDQEDMDTKGGKVLALDKVLHDRLKSSAINTCLHTFLRYGIGGCEWKSCHPESRTRHHYGGRYCPAWRHYSIHNL